MQIKIDNYNITTSNTSTGTTISDIPEAESFQEVLVLNQTALKAMTIDAMVAESATGSVSPDAVNAAAIMKFRSTLGSHVKAPMPQEDRNDGPKKVNKDSAISENTKPSENTSSKDTTTNTDITENITQNSTVNNSVSNVYNSGVLKCSDELNRYFQEAAETYGIDVKLLKSIAYAESNFNPNCTSKSGAMGVMQLMPSTAKTLSVSNAYNARENIMGGAKYISKQLKDFDGNISLALAAYNAGPGNVKKYNGIPPFEETQNYVKKVLNCYHSE